MADAHAPGALRLWLRLYTCATLIEGELRARLRAQCSISFARFELMAQLERHPQGLRMGELSRRMMVTGGDVTGLVDQLAGEGLVERRPIAGDRRAHAVRLTPRGQEAWATMSQQHEGWVDALTARLAPQERSELLRLLGILKAGVLDQVGER